MDISARKKELEKINQDIRERAAMKVNLENECKVLKARRTEFSDELKNVTNELHAVTAQYAAKNMELQAVIKRAKASEKESQSILDSVLDEKKKLDKARGDIAAGKADVVDLLKQLESGRNELKTQKTGNEALLNEIASKKAVFDENKGILEARENALKKDLEVIRQRELKVAHDKSELETLDKRLEAAYSDLDEQKQAIDSEKKAIKALNIDLKQSQAACNEKLAALDKKESIYDAKLSKLKSDVENHERNVAALENNKKEIRVRELRVEKLIRDNNVDKELKKLEAELKS